MIRRLFLLAALALCSIGAFALTTPQLQTLKAAILAETDPAFVQARTLGQTSVMRDFYNANSTFVVYKTSETVAAVGRAVNYVAFEGTVSEADINAALEIQ
jgi:hypothetical protein